VAQSQAFVFTDSGIQVGEGALTLTGLLAGIRTLPDPVVIDHLRRHDFSQWIADALGDRDFSSSIQNLESIYHEKKGVDAFADKLAKEIQRRYGHDL
jgi:hypothetical protein